MAKRRREREGGAWRGLPARAVAILGALLFAAAFWGATAQEPGSDPAGEASAQRQERSGESAALNLEAGRASTRDLRQARAPMILVHGDCGSGKSAAQSGGPSRPPIAAPPMMSANF